MFLNALKQLEQFKKEYPEHEGFIFRSKKRIIISHYPLRYFDGFDYKPEYDSLTYMEELPEHGDDLRIFRFKKNIREFLITHRIYDIQFNPYQSNFLCFFVKHYDSKELAAKVIWKYYKKYRYNLFRKRLDPLKKELMEYCWHPSRVCEELCYPIYQFEIDSESDSESEPSIELQIKILDIEIQAKMKLREYLQSKLI